MKEVENELKEEVDELPIVNTAPSLDVSDKTIALGDKFNPLDGVSANDKEDGDLTANIKVQGDVDVTKAGIYRVTYSVTDSKGLTTEKTIVITVKDKGIDVSPEPDSGEDETIPNEEKPQPPVKDETIKPNSNPDKPKTDDESNVMLYASIVGLALVSGTIIILNKR